MMNIDDTTKVKIWQDMYKQAAWERDVAIKQLEQLGYELGEKIKPDHFREDAKKIDEESISKQEVLTNMRTLCDGCYLMEHCGQCNPNCLLRKAVDVVEKIKTDSERVSLSEQEKSNLFSEEPSEDSESEMNCDEWWKNYIRLRMSRDDVPDNNAGKTEFKPGDKFILELGQERKMFDEFEIVGTDLYVKTSLLEKLTRYEPEEKTTTDKIMIDLAEAIKTVKFECGEFEGLAQRIVNGLEKLPPKQSEKIPEIICDPDCEGFVCHKNGIHGWCPKTERWGCDYFYEPELERRNDG